MADGVRVGLAFIPFWLDDTTRGQECGNNKWLFGISGDFVILSEAKNPNLSGMLHCVQHDIFNTP
jgi:hypothetical protein